MTDASASDPRSPAGPASLDVRNEGGGRVLVFSGPLSFATTGAVWKQALGAVEGPGPVAVEAGGVAYCDGAGLGLLIELRRRARKSGAAFELRGLAAKIQALLDLVPDEAPETDAPSPRKTSLPEDVGRATVQVLEDLRTQVTFLGEMLAATASAIAHPGRVRWRDALAVANAAGVNALPIISLMGFLIGLILAFQSAVPLKQFGAEVYVADLVSVGVIRELGPLMTAIMLAGRSGSAFAAELGTMKVNEEIDALSTMGMRPVRFLVVPRVLAGIFVAPVLTLYMDLLALVGAAIVVMSMGYTVVTFVNHAFGVLSIEVLLASLVKSLVFGMIVASVGCQRGLSAGSGAASVGTSTTRSVVAGILLTIVADGIFAVILFVLGW